MNIRHIITLAFFAIWLAIGAGCNPATGSSANTPLVSTSPALTDTITPSPPSDGIVAAVVGVASGTPFVFARDCGWSATLTAWLDMNGNGKRDSSEPPMPNVRFFFANAGISGGYVRGPFITDFKGETQTSEFMPGCPSVVFEVYPETPAGFTPSTPSRMQATGPGFQSAFEFGFTYEKGAATATPRPAAPVCTVFRLLSSSPDDSVSDIAVAHDGSVWVATYGHGVARQLPGENTWKFFTEQDVLGANDVNRITAMDDGSVWFATLNGASRFDGKTWKTFTTADGLLNNYVRSIAKAPDGSLWFATKDGVSRYMPDKNQWQSYTVQNGLIEE